METRGKKRVITSYSIHYTKLYDAFYGSHGLFAFRKHLPFYVQGMPGAGTVRSALVRTESVDAVRDGLMRVLQ